MTGDEGQLAFPRARRRPLEVVLRARRSIVLVGADETDVEVVAREVEIVGVAAEERDGELWREHHAHVLEALVLVQVVDAAVVQRHHVAAHLRVVSRAFLLDPGHRRALRFRELLPFQPLRRGVDALRDVGDRDELVQLDLGALHFLLDRRGVEPLFDEVLVPGGQLLDAAMRAMVVRHHQAIW